MMELNEVKTPLMGERQSQLRLPILSAPSLKSKIGESKKRASLPFSRQIGGLHRSASHL